MKSRFEDEILKLRIIARKIVEKWDNEFAVDELVNEAWIKSDFKDKEVDIPLLLRSAHCDMIDYVRLKKGRKYSYIGGKKEELKKRPSFITNFDVSSDGKHGLYRSSDYFNSLFEIASPRNDDDVKGVDDRDLVEYVLNAPTKRQAKALRRYFLEGKTLKEVAETLGNKECTTSQIVKRGLARCRKKLEKIGMEIL